MDTADDATGSPAPPLAALAASPPDTPETRAIRVLAAQCGPGRSFAPEQAARLAAGEGWHAALGRVRKAAIALAMAGEIEILRKGKPVALPDGARGVLRLRAAPASIGQFSIAPPGAAEADKQG